MKSPHLLLVVSTICVLLATILFLSPALNDLTARIKSPGHDIRNSTIAWPKYFHEGGDTTILTHYDFRFQHGPVTDEIRRDAQVHMLRAYLDFFKQQKLQTWLAHGTLLGWWWNAKVCSHLLFTRSFVFLVLMSFSKDSTVGQ